MTNNVIITALFIYYEINFYYIGPKLTVQVEELKDYHIVQIGCGGDESAKSHYHAISREGKFLNYLINSIDTGISKQIISNNTFVNGN